MRLVHDSCDVNTTRLDVDEEQDVLANEPDQGERLDGKEGVAARTPK
jgi:hypothetical protein